MKDANLVPPFVHANGRWYLVLDWEPGRRHGPLSIRPLTPLELELLNRYIDDSMTEAWALITAARFGREGL